VSLAIDIKEPYFPVSLAYIFDNRVLSEEAIGIFKGDAKLL